MAEIKVSQLPEASEINDSDLLMIVQSGTNKKITKANARFASGDEIYVGDTEPTGDDADSVKLWLSDDDALVGEGSYISNSYGTSQTIGYSQEYLNGAIGKLGKTLWTGTFTTGSTTIPDISKYSIIGVIADGVLCIGTKSFGGGIYGAYGSSNYGVVSYRISVSGDTLSTNANDKGAFNNGSQVTITQIIGLF